MIIINYVGYHVWDIPSDFNLTLGLKWGYAVRPHTNSPASRYSQLTPSQTELLYNPILAIVKTSILLFLWRLTGQKVAVRRTILGLLIFNNVAMLLTFLITVFNCVPIAASWAPASYPNRKCKIAFKKKMLQDWKLIGVRHELCRFCDWHGFGGGADRCFGLAAPDVDCV